VIYASTLVDELVALEPLDYGGTDAYVLRDPKGKRWRERGPVAIPAWPTLARHEILLQPHRCSEVSDGRT